METMDLLAYASDPVPVSVREAAGDAAAQCGYDRFEEVLLDHEVVGVRRVSAQSVRAHYAEWLQPPCSFSPDEIVRVDWHTWAVPRGFDGTYEQAVIARAESVIVALPTLMAREVFTHGLGPEYNWLDWAEGSSSPGEPTAAAFEALGALITGDWRDYVREDADEDASYLDAIHPDLRAAVAEAIGDRDERP
jgi:hypothetical protein